MPFISTKASCTISSEQETALKQKFGKAIELLPGKTERWLMLDFEDKCRMWFAGENKPSAMLEVKIFGGASDDAYDKLTARLTDDVSGVLGIAPSKIYIKYEEVSQWGWNGSNF